MHNKATKVCVKFVFHDRKKSCKVEKKKHNSDVKSNTFFKHCEGKKKRASSWRGKKTAIKSSPFVSVKSTLREELQPLLFTVKKKRNSLTLFAALHTHLFFT